MRVRSRGRARRAGLSQRMGFEVCVSAQSAFHRLYYPANPFPPPPAELRDLDLLIRQKIELLVEIKVDPTRRVFTPLSSLTDRPITLRQNAFSSHLVITLHRISDLQSTIARLPPILSGLEADLRSPPGFNHIYRFSIMPQAYGRLLVEAVRRREFGQSTLLDLVDPRVD